MPNILASFADSLTGFHSMFCYEGDPRKLTKKKKSGGDLK